jgi:hypothetical protein
VKPLFIPLKTEYFEAFRAGTKDTEYRRHGSLWNEDVCQVGRPVVLSKGYGKSERLSGVITGFEVRFLRSDDFVACYGEPGWAACIQIRLSPPQTSAQEPKA